MKGYTFAVIAAAVALGLVSQSAEARIIKGSTVSKYHNLQVSAVDIDGSCVSERVRVVSQFEGPDGTVYRGRYSLDVPEGAKVSIVFSRVRAGGLLRAKTVANFSDGNGGMSTQIPVTPPLADGSNAISLGRTEVGEPLSTCSRDPLDDVDSDDDSVNDLDDVDDDNDSINDVDDLDDDGDGYDDLDEDMDADDDGSPDMVDADDDNDGFDDSVDADDDNDEILDVDEPDADDDGISDADDADDDNDGLSDDVDDDDDGDGVNDDDEVTSIIQQVWPSNGGSCRVLVLNSNGSKFRTVVIS
jgi:hypothetical protein